MEDHAAVRDVTVRALARQGYEVLSAANPEEALQRAEAVTGKIHLVVTDVVMPGMGGPEMVGRLLAERPDLRVLYVSGYNRDNLKQGAPGAEHDLLQKPFTPDLLARKVRDDPRPREVSVERLSAREVAPARGHRSVGGFRRRRPAFSRAAWSFRTSRAAFHMAMFTANSSTCSG